MAGEALPDLLFELGFAAAVPRAEPEGFGQRVQVGDRLGNLFAKEHVAAFGADVVDAPRQGPDFARVAEGGVGRYEASTPALGFDDYGCRREAGDDAVASEEGCGLRAGAGREVGDEGGAGGGSNTLSVAGVAAGVDFLGPGRDDGDGPQAGFQRGSVRADVHAVCESAHNHRLTLRLSEGEDYFPGPFLPVERNVARAHYRDKRRIVEYLLNGADAFQVESGRAVGAFGQRLGIAWLSECYEIYTLFVEGVQLSCAFEKFVVGEGSAEARKGTQQGVPLAFVHSEKRFDRTGFFDKTDCDLRGVAEGAAERAGSGLDEF